jgi:hypothetical protein
MRLILLTVLVALGAGLLTGGSLREFPTIRTRWWWLALVGVAMQFFTSGGTLGVALLLGSFVALLAFVVANVRAPGFPLVLVGLVLNLAVITANQGMPVTRHALEASGQGSTLAELATNGDGQKHYLAVEGDGTDLLPLGDVIALGGPVSQAISIGDICVHLGIAWFIVMAMRRRDTVPTLEPGHAEI